LPPITTPCSVRIPESGLWGSAATRTC
jgi:hypothetical protein